MSGRLRHSLGIEPSKRLGQNFVVDAGHRHADHGAWPDCDADDVVLEVGPGFGSLTLPLLAAARRVLRRRNRPGARGRASADGRGQGAAAIGPPRGRAGRRRPGWRAARRAADRAGGQPAVQRLGPGRAAPAGHRAVAAAGACDGAGRGRRPDVRAARQPDLRSAVGQDCLVRYRTPDRFGWPRGLLAGAAGGLGPGGAGPAPSVPMPRGLHGTARQGGGLRGGRRCLLAAAQDAARGAGGLGRLGLPPRRRCCVQRRSIRRCAARLWASPNSPG